MTYQRSVYDGRDFGVVGDGVADDTAAMQAAIDAAKSVDLNAAGVVVFGAGKYKITSTLVVDEHVTIICHGTIQLGGVAGTAAFQIGDPLGARLFLLRIFVHRIEGTGKANGQDGFQLRNMAWGLIEVQRILHCRYAFHLQQQGDDAQTSESKFRYGIISNCTKAVFFEDKSAGATIKNHEGNQFEGGLVAACDAGFEFDPNMNAGGTWITGTVDNADVGGSTDYVNNMTGKLGNVLAIKFIREAATTLGGGDLLLMPGGTSHFNGADKTAGVQINSDGSLEIWRNVGNPFIDLKDDVADDFDVRLGKTAGHALDIHVGGAGSPVEYRLNPTHIELFTNFIEGDEQADPAAPAANTGRIYFRDNGAGKTQLVVRFATGAVQVIATEP